MKTNTDRLFLSSLILIGTLVYGMFPSDASAGEFSAEQMKKMGIFLSNFTECNYTTISRREFIDKPDEMVNFALCHNWINNFRSFTLKNSCGKEKTDGNYFAHLDPKNVEKTVKKYLDYDFSAHQGHGDYIVYDGYTYCIPAADGEQHPAVKVVSADRQEDGTILVKGSSYYPDSEEDADDNINVKAVIKPYVWNGKDTWSLVSMNMEPKAFPD